MEKEKLEEGMIVKHILTNEEILILAAGKEQWKCRLQNLSEEWFYEFELKAQ